jgi:nitrous oxidase accessory protein NosD
MDTAGIDAAHQPSEALDRVVASSTGSKHSLVLNQIDLKRGRQQVPSFREKGVIERRPKLRACGSQAVKSFPKLR